MSFGGQKRNQNKLFCGKCGPQIFTRGPQRNVPGPGTFMSGPHFFMSGPHFFTRSPQRNVPGPGIFFERPSERKMIMPEIKGSSLFFHKKPLTLHPTLVQVVQGFSDYALTAKTMKTKRPVCTCTRGIYGLKAYAGEMRQPYCIIRRMCCSRMWKAGATMAPWSWPSSS